MMEARFEIFQRLHKALFMVYLNKTFVKVVPSTLYWDNGCWLSRAEKSGVFNRRQASLS